MRARNIKPGLWKDEDLASLPMAARYLFPGLWCLADCVGRLEDRPRLIKAELFPFDDDISAATVHHLLQQLHDSGFIQRYEIGANRYIQVVNFEKHQNPHKNEKEKGSQIPEPTPVVHVPNLSEPVPIKSEQGPNNSKPLGLIPDSLLLIPSSLIPENGLRIPAQSGAPIFMPRASDFPLTDAAIRRRCPTADLMIVSRITEAAIQSYLSVDRPKTQPPTDADIADAVEKAATNSPKQQGAGLFLKTVPAVIRSWAEIGKARDPSSAPRLMF